ncbi:hypothetical protein ISCGN_006570 [Ixodes scapularis]
MSNPNPKEVRSRGTQGAKRDRQLSVFPRVSSTTSLRLPPGLLNEPLETGADCLVHTGVPPLSPEFTDVVLPESNWRPCFRLGSLNSRAFLTNDASAGTQVPRYTRRNHGHKNALGRRSGRLVVATQSRVYSVLTSQSTYSRHCVRATAAARCPEYKFVATVFHQVCAHF